jgi:hypothetical protein
LGLLETATFEALDRSTIIPIGVEEIVIEISQFDRIHGGITRVRVLPDAGPKLEIESYVALSSRPWAGTYNRQCRSNARLEPQHLSTRKTGGYGS